MSRSATAILISFLLVSPVQRESGAKISRPPNIVFMLADDQRFDTINALGNREIITPNLDRLVREGTSFTRAYIMGGDSGAVCIPSRAMLLTGRSLFRSQPFIEGKSMPEVLRQAGYETFGTGKWHNEKDTFARGFTSGADIFFGGMSDHLSVPLYDFDPAGGYPDRSRRIGDRFSSELFADSAVRFLREYRGEAPFFLYLSFTAPHDPRTAPESYRRMYDDRRIRIPPNFRRRHPFDNGEMEIRDEKLAPWPRTPEVVRAHIADYYAMITHLDAQIGRVLAALAETGKDENTIVIFSSDNGLAVGQHGLLGKQSVYEHSVRVPLVFRGVGIPRDRRSESLCYLFDIFPTICELTGVPVPDTVEGLSLAPELRGGPRSDRKSVFFGYKDVQRGFSDGRYKLIEYYVGASGKGTRTTQLFDLRHDPWETRDLSKLSRYAPELSRLRADLGRWARVWDDPLIPKDRSSRANRE